MVKKENVIITLLIVIAALLAVQIFLGRVPDNNAYAQGAGGRFAVVRGGIEGSSAEIVYLFDETTRHVVTYHQSGRTPGRKLELLSIRNIEYDLQFDEWNIGKPSPEDLKKQLDRKK